LIVPLKQGNLLRRTLWRKAKRRPTDSLEGNMLNTSRFLTHVNVTRSDNYGDHLWMVNLSVEEPDALMCARPGLWEPRVGNDPGPPGQFLEGLGRKTNETATTKAYFISHDPQRRQLTRNQQPSNQRSVGQRSKPTQGQPKPIPPAEPKPNSLNQNRQTAFSTTRP